jgi:putative flippase GtrA
MSEHRRRASAEERSEWCDERSREERIVHMTRHELFRGFRFVIVNGVGTIADISLVYLLHYVLHRPLLIAVFSGWLVSGLCGYVLNRRFVFADGHASLLKSSFRYVLLVVFNLAVGVGGVTWLVAHGWNYILTRLLSSTFLVITNFLVSRRWVFVVMPPIAERIETP